MSKEFYQNLGTFFKTYDNDDNQTVDEFNVDMDDEELFKLFSEILPELDKYNENLDINAYFSE